MLFKTSNTKSENTLYKNELFIHLLFWIIYLLFPFIKSIGRSDYHYNFISELIDFFFGIIIFYLAYVLIFPLNRKIFSLIILILVFSILGYINFSLHNELFGGVHQKAFWYYAFSYFSTYTVLTLFAFALYSSKKNYKKRIILEEEIRKRRESELFNLRAQINPHFLFNTLNTIYSSALKKEDKVPEMILKLSDNFRYVLEEGLNKYVTIKKEIIHLKDYISLQEERLANRVTVNFNFSIDDYNQKIAPLLLISFIENSFKYVSTLKNTSNTIIINLTLINGELSFYCENPYNNQEQAEIDFNWEKSGIGIKNTKKRLDYLYSNNYNLQIKSTGKLFKVTLKIKL